MSTDLVTTQGAALALEPDQDWWTPSQATALQHLGVERASQGDLMVFFHVCQRTGLDPFARQIYMIERQGKQTIQTGIDGLRLVARRAVNRSGEKLAIGASEWCAADEVWRGIWVGDTPPTAARVIVYRDGEPFPGTALWDEYVQTKRDGSITAMWATRGAGQLAKCAEALALRKAFPQELSGVYTEDEVRTSDRDGHERRGGLAAALHEPSGPEAPDATPSASEETPGPESPLLTAGSPLAKAMHATFNEAGITEREDRLRYCTDLLQRDIGSSDDMTEAETSRVIDAVKADLAQPFPKDQS